jgi:hypothetical protein
MSFIFGRLSGEQQGGPHLGRHPEVNQPDFTGIDGGHGHNLTERPAISRENFAATRCAVAGRR